LSSPQYSRLPLLSSTVERVCPRPREGS
jgi:hypothetical protein